ncbi:helix-turn-helix domain-containing protein [Azohydromonas lata]|uniref:GAF domain-containing protein n=1 Tax=Azohydromonas lata TaxID=45677 RepID=A0ABU5IM17_9BURK|nr:GAF domain-containing protein [Azohydromonas lata]MDZ5459937.1 GAF domain-containing protein [Azohydromonas lata]
MKLAVQNHGAEDMVRDLVKLLHRGAPADEFASRLAQVEKLPAGLPQKSTLAEMVRMAMAIQNRLDLLQQREQGMRAVIESAQDLSSHLDLPGLLRAVVSRARNLLGAHLAWLSSYAPEKHEFHVLVNDGALLQDTTHMVAREQAGVVGVIMATRMPFSTPDYLHDNRFTHDPELDATLRGEGIVALAGVPLIWNEEIVGLLFVADRYHRTHTALNTSILSALAAHAAVAIKNARAFEQAQSALAEAGRARLELERHILSVKSAAEAHEKMTALLAQGAPLSALCQALAQSLNAGVVVWDEGAQVISHGRAAEYPGSQAGGHFVLQGEHSLEITQALRQSRLAGRSRQAYQSQGETCTVMAVVGGNDVLGSVLLFHRQILDETAVSILERSANLMAIVLLSQERSEAVKSRDVSQLLRSLVSLRQDPPALLLDQARRFGLDLEQPVCLIAIEMDETKAAYAARRLRARPELAHTIFDEIDGLLVILCAATQAQDKLRTLQALGQPEFGRTYRGVISKPVSSPQGVPAVYATLRRAMAVLSRIGVQGSIIAQNEMALYSTLFETHDRESLDNFLEATLGPLLSYDQKRGSELTRTLLTYFDNNQNARTTAQRLKIHVNTVRQRLATVEELVGHLGQATRALEIHMALRLWNLGIAQPR